MAWKIIQLLISVGLIIGGLSGEFVLRGTDSSAALVAVGVLWLIFDIVQFFSFKKKTENAQPRKQRKGRSPLFFILCGVYIIANLVCAFLLLDELTVVDGTVMEIIALCGIAVSITGTIQLLIKKSFGIIVALTGSAITVVFTILSGVFIHDYPTPSFLIEDFILFMLMTLLPGFLLWLQIQLAKNKLAE